MSDNSFGKLLTITTFGESHGEALGVVIDGLPPKLKFSLEDLKKELKRRAPGQQAWTTSRKEEDHPEILSGIFEGQSLGTPIAVIVKNTNQRSGDYDKLKDEYRPGHADQTTLMKYGIRDHRGGGRSSGRETLARVIGGYFAGLLLPELKITSYVDVVGPFKTQHAVDVDQLTPFSGFPFPDENKAREIEQYLLECKQKGESVGGSVVVVIKNVPAGLGAPTFHKLKADLAHAMLGIGACTGFVYGRGEEFATLLGSEISQDRTNFGGMEGGITNGEDLQFKVFFKAPSTVGEKAREGRHDPCIIPRAIPVVEAMAKLVLADHLLRQKTLSYSQK